jgi:hypothetical protein
VLQKLLPDLTTTAAAAAFTAGWIDSINLSSFTSLREFQATHCREYIVLHFYKKITIKIAKKIFK